MSHPPPICFDARWNGPFGIGRYSAEVRSRLHGEVHDLVVGGGPLSPVGLLAWEGRVQRARRGLPAETVLLSPAFTPSLTWRGPAAVTVHDLIHLDVPDEYSRAKSLYYEAVLRPALRRNPVTFTVSEFSRVRLTEWAGIDPARIVVTGNAADARFRPEGPRHEPGYDYVLCIRNAKPHKNTPRLIEAFAMLPHPQLRLVLSGQPDAAACEAAARHRVTDRVVFAGHIPEEDLPAFYRGAELLAFPSLYEGFGIPAVEAMACGTPVVAADAPSLPEVVGGAGILVDPRDTQSISDGLERALTDTLLRGHLRTAGPTRAAEFSWDTVADRVQTALDELSG